MKTVKHKPHWPEWAKYKATDANGDMYFYSIAPIRFVGRVKWSCIRSNLRMSVNKYAYHKTKENYKNDWTKSLRAIED